MTNGSMPFGTQGWQQSRHGAPDRVQPAQDLARLRDAAGRVNAFHHKPPWLSQSGACDHIMDV